MLFPDLPAAPVQAPRVFASRAWQEAVSAITSLDTVTERAARSFIGRLKKQGLSDEDLLMIAKSAREVMTGDPISYFQAAAKSAIAKRATPTDIHAPSEARQRSWMQDWIANPAGWRRHERGPEPGEPGCRVSPSLLREFGCG
jgi:hypothetical protein